MPTLLTGGKNKYGGSNLLFKFHSHMTPSLIAPAVDIALEIRSLNTRRAKSKMLFYF